MPRPNRLGLTSHVPVLGPTPLRERRRREEIRARKKKKRSSNVSLGCYMCFRDSCDLIGRTSLASGGGRM